MRGMSGHIAFRLMECFVFLMRIEFFRQLLRRRSRIPWLEARRKLLGSASEVFLRNDLILQGSLAAAARAAGAWLRRALRALPIRQIAATAPPRKPVSLLALSQTLLARCRQIRCFGFACSCRQNCRSRFRLGSAARGCSIR